MAWSYEKHEKWQRKPINKLNWFIWKLTIDSFKQKGFWYILNLVNTNESRFFCFNWKRNRQMEQQIQNKEKKNDKIINKWWTAWSVHQNYNVSIVKCFLFIHICFCSRTMAQFFWKIISKSVLKKKKMMPTTFIELSDV